MENSVFLRNLEAGTDSISTGSLNESQTVTKAHSTVSAPLLRLVIDMDMPVLVGELNPHANVSITGTSCPLIL